MAGPIVREERIGDCRLIQGDCLSIMPLLDPVDAVVTDPPYGVNYSGSSTRHTVDERNGYASFDDTPEYIREVCVPAINMAIGMAKRVCLTPGIPNARLYPQPNAEGVIWYPSGANRGPWGFVTHQPIFYYGKCPFLAVGKGSMPTGFQSTEAAEKNDHPCPKPINQMRWLVWRSTIEGEAILDPFMGSGTTLVACAKMGRKGIGIELDPDYFDIACKRVEEAYRQPDLFVPSPTKIEQDEMDL